MATPAVNRSTFASVYRMSDENGGPGTVIQSFLSPHELANVAIAYRDGGTGIAYMKKARAFTLLMAESFPLDQMFSHLLIGLQPQQVAQVKSLFANYQQAMVKELTPVVCRILTPAEIEHQLYFLSSPLTRSVGQKMPLVIQNMRQFAQDSHNRFEIPLRRILLDAQTGPAVLARPPL